jgi:hypothetical protein
MDSYIVAIAKFATLHDLAYRSPLRRLRRLVAEEIPDAGKRDPQFGI